MVSTAGAIVIAIVVLLIAAVIGWIVFTQLRARRLGLPGPSLSSYLPWRKSDAPYGPPQPARGGIIGWFNDQMRKFKHRNNRSATGSYEPRDRRGGFGPLDGDDAAWDSRVGHDADAYGYYEEQELGATRTEYTGYRGRQMDRTAYNSQPPHVNPFDDDVVGLDGAGRGVGKPTTERPGSAGSSHGERKSIFREDV